MTPCPAENTLLQFVAGDLSAEEAAAVLSHVDECPACGPLLMDVARPVAGTSQTLPQTSDPAEGPQPWSPPEQIEEYRLVRPLGQGAMGQVYIAHDTRLDRDVAIKFIAAPEPDEAARERFLVEARAIARLQHPNVVAIHRVGELAGRPYLVSEFVRGQSLDQLPLPLSAERVLHIALGLSRGLAAAHRRGVLHRDIKPANAILARDGEVKLLDFGLAKLLDASFRPGPDGPTSSPAAAWAERPALALGATASAAPDRASAGGLTRSGAILGTPRYMAPEIWRGERSTSRSDVYSLGALLYELCTGRPPYEAKTLAELHDAVQKGAVVPLSRVAPGTDAELAAIIDRCVMRDAAARYASGEELHQALDRLVEAQRARPLAVRARRWAAAVVALVLALGVGVSFLPGRALWTGKGRRTVAVLGFQNLGGRPETAWLSTALSDLLGAELAIGDRLRMIPGESVSRMKRELQLPEADGYASDTVARIRKNLGTDLLLVGSYLTQGDEKRRRVQLALRLQDAAGGEILASVSEMGSEAELVDSVSRVGNRLREKLGLGRAPPDASAGLAALYPHNPEVARLYAEGREKLRSFDAMGARVLLEKAVEAGPDYPLAHDALAEAWTALGYDDKAKLAAKRAFELSGKLPREERLLIEARYRTTAGERDKAVEIHRALVTFFPDSLEHGLRLAEAQSTAGHPRDAVATLSGLRRLPAPARDDPRIDIAEGIADIEFSDLKAQLAAAQRAVSKGRERGALLLVAKARIMEAEAQAMLGDHAQGFAAAQEAKQIYASAGDRFGVGDALSAIGVLHSRDQGDLPAALAAEEEALQIIRALGHQPGLMILLNNTANALCRLGRLAAAQARADESLTLLARQIGRQDTIAITYTLLGWIAVLQGRLTAARKSFDEALGVSRRQLDRMLQAWALWHIGELLRLEGDLAEARKRHEEALALREAGGLKVYFAESRLALAALALDEGQQPPAAVETMARRAVEEARDARNADNVAWAQAILSRALLAQGKLQEAQQEVAQATARTSVSHNLLIRLTVAPIAARVRAASKQPADLAAARKDLEGALDQAKAAGILGDQFEARLALGEIELAAGQIPAGRTHLTALAREATKAGYHLIARKGQLAVTGSRR